VSGFLNREAWVSLGLLALLLPAPFFVSDYTVRILNLGLISAVAVLGLNFAFGWTGLISLAQAAFVGCGAYLAALLTARLGLDVWSAAAISVAATGVAAALIGFPMLRLSGHYLALATLGLNVSFEIVTSNWVEVTGGTNGIAGIPSFLIFGLALGREAQFLPVAWTLLVLLTLVAYRLRASRFGRAMIAMRDDEIATRMSGVGAVALKITAFALSAVYAALAGVLFAYHGNFISPGDFGYVHSIFYLSMLIVGGEGSVLGAVLGAVIVTFLPEWLRPLGEAYLTFFGMFLLAILVFLPKGLISLFPFLGSSPAPTSLADSPAPALGKRDAA
jgi:branched-chain amino acid transport system permease protein